jgi:hypothetical protein
LKRIELSTSSLPRKCSTPELQRLVKSRDLSHGWLHRSNFTRLTLHGAEDEVRTRDLQLGRLSLYQLSYFRLSNTVALAPALSTTFNSLQTPVSAQAKDSGRYPFRRKPKIRGVTRFGASRSYGAFDSWARMDSNHRTPKRTDLQSVAVGHLATCPLPEEFIPPKIPRDLFPYRAREGTRTPDQLITNQLLYQLSYSGW